MKIRDMVKFETITGEPLQIGDRSLQLQNHVFRLYTPWGGLVHNRPAGVLIDAGDGTEWIPVVDVTRIAQLVLFISAASFTMLRWRFAARARAGRRAPNSRAGS